MDGSFIFYKQNINGVERKYVAMSIEIVYEIVVIEVIS